MFRRDVWQKLGGFDETFHPIWFEDVDFCRRAPIAGFGIQYVPPLTARPSGRPFDRPGWQRDAGHGIGVLAF